MNKIKIVTIASLIILVFALTVTAYAASLTLYSPTYTYAGTISGIIENSEDGTNWDTTAITNNSPSNWFCRLTTTATGYSGSAMIGWHLEKSTDGGTTWFDVSGATVSTGVIFTGASGQIIYAPISGTDSGHRNWIGDFTGTGKYRVQVDLTY